MTGEAWPDRLLAAELDMAYRRRARVLLGMLEVDSGVAVLDAGCGEGFYVAAVLERGDASAVGLDGSLPRLRCLARRHAAPAAAGDLHRLPFASGAFDRVLLSEVLEHLEDDALGLAEAHRVLKPGGIAAISVPHADYPFWWDPIGRTLEALGLPPIRSGPLVGIWTGHVRLYRPAELTALVERSGFAVEACDELTHHAFPFSHFLLYGVGKPLLEKGLVPAALRASACRFERPPEREGPLNPVRLVRRLLAAVDARNERPARRRPRTFVNVVVKARRR